MLMARLANCWGEKVSFLDFAWDKGACCQLTPSVTHLPPMPMLPNHLLEKMEDWEKRPAYRVSSNQGMGTERPHSLRRISSNAQR